MIKEILTYLPYLFLAISLNIVGGTFNQVKMLHNTFSKETFKDGLYKAFVISYMFIGLAIIFDMVFTKLGIQNDIADILPNALLISSIALYSGKAIMNLKEILTTYSNDFNFDEDL